MAMLSCLSGTVTRQERVSPGSSSTLTTLAGLSAAEMCIRDSRHCEFISATVKKALLGAGKTIDDVDAVAVTFAPGLIGAVLVGVNFAKGLALSLIHISAFTRRFSHTKGFHL